MQTTQEKVIELINERIERLDERYNEMIGWGRGRTSAMDRLDGGLHELELLRDKLTES